MKVIKATVFTHGFDGWIGLCEGHPDLENATDEDSISSSLPTSQLMEFLLKQKEEGNGDKSLNDILAVWDGARGSPKATSEIQELATVTPPSEKAILAPVGSPPTLPSASSTPVDSPPS